VAPKVFTNPEASITVLTLLNQQKIHDVVNVRKYENPPGTAPPSLTTPSRPAPGPGPHRTGFAFTGGDVLPLTVTGLAPLLAGGLLFWLSRRPRSRGRQP
jgi:hypothetical protein